jgi:catechol 2,3-dioxygenase-like lactoylglutathione lyase family enzyme
MFKQNQAFSSFSVSDIDKALHFYRDTLGLDVDTSYDLELRLGSGGKVFIYPKPDHKPASFTVLNFKTTDIEGDIAALRQRGVQFQQYGGDIKTDELGIFSDGKMKIAWFADPAGNILSIIQD